MWFSLSDTVNNIHAAQSFRHLQHDRWHLPLLSVFFFLYLFAFLSVKITFRVEQRVKQRDGVKIEARFYGKAFEFTL